MSSEISKAIKILCEEKNLSFEAVMETIEAALAAAYRKDYGNKQQNIKVKFDPETADMQVWDVKTVVKDIDEETLEKSREELSTRREAAFKENRELTEEEMEDLPRFNPKTEIMLAESKEMKKNSKLGDVLEMEQDVPGDFGRMAAQTAKQVIIQKIREAERNMVFGDFKDQEGKLVMGVVQRVETRKILVDLGKVTGVVPAEEQSRTEHYRPGSRMKFYVVSVEMTNRGPEIILSRSNESMVREIFKENVPEIADEVVEIKNIAREAGFRSKVAVYTEDDSIDPIGSCIGQRGSRINTIIEELSGEKVDIIEYVENSEDYIKNALSPAKIIKVELDDLNKVAQVTVAEDQFSLAIGRGGQNVRLASELTGWKIDVVQDGSELNASGEDEEEKIEELKEKSSADDSSTDEESDVKKVEKKEAKKKTKKEDKEPVAEEKKAKKKSKKDKTADETIKEDDKVVE